MVKKGGSIYGRRPVPNLVTTISGKGIGWVLAVIFKPRPPFLL